MFGRRFTELSYYGCTRLKATCYQKNLVYPITRQHKGWWSTYNQDAIAAAADKPLRLLTPTQLMFTGKCPDGLHLLQSSQFLQSELPRRIARRVKDLESLPKIAEQNSSMQELHDLYIEAFQQLSTFRKIETLTDEEDFKELLHRFLDGHRNVVSLLAQAFRILKQDIPYDVLGPMTDRTLKEKLAIRLLIEHHLGLSGEKKDYIGAICTHTSPKHIIEYCHYLTQRMCEHRHGCSPGVMLSGHTKTFFAHFPCTLEYILQELLKNAMEATIVHHKKFRSKNADMPSIDVTICNNKEFFVIRISDKGGGVPEKRLEEIFKYSVTSHDDQSEGELQNQQEDGGAFNTFMDAVNIESVGRISGYGFGLPSAQAYAEFLGGSLTFVPMLGLGSDVYLKISHVTSDTIKI